MISLLPARPIGTASTASTRIRIAATTMAPERVPACTPSGLDRKLVAMSAMPPPSRKKTPDSLNRNETPPAIPATINQWRRPVSTAMSSASAPKVAKYRLNHDGIAAG